MEQMYPDHVEPTIGELWSPRYLCGQSVTFCARPRVNMSIVNVPIVVRTIASDQSVSEKSERYLSGKVGEQREREEWFRATRERD